MFWYLHLTKTLSFSSARYLLSSPFSKFPAKLVLIPPSPPKNNVGLIKYQMTDISKCHQHWFWGRGGVSWKIKQIFSVPIYFVRDQFEIFHTISSCALTIHLLCFYTDGYCLKMWRHGFSSPANLTSWKRGYRRC